jgi:hypothetical protein
MSGSTGIPHSIILEEIPGIPMEYTEVLKTRNIQCTNEFTEATRTRQQREALAAFTGIPRGRIEEIRSLCDLSRIDGIPATAVRALYHAGIRSVEVLAEQPAAALWQKLTSESSPYGSALLSLKMEETAEWVNRAGNLVSPEPGIADGE